MGVEVPEVGVLRGVTGGSDGEGLSLVEVGLALGVVEVAKLEDVLPVLEAVDPPGLDVEGRDAPVIAVEAAAKLGGHPGPEQPTHAPEGYIAQPAVRDDLLLPRAVGAVEERRVRRPGGVHNDEVVGGREEA